MVDNTTLNTGSGGDTIATDEVSTLNGAASSGVKVPRNKMGFGSDGAYVDIDDTHPLPITIRSQTASFRAFVPSQAVGASKVYFDLFNAAGSGKVLKIKSVRAIKNGSVAVTGTLAVQLFLTRTTTVGTGGTAATTEGSSLTAMTISEMDSASAALPAEISGRLTPAGGATAGAVISERQVFAEETNASGYDHPEFLNPSLVDVQPLVLREGQGIRVVQGAVASVGNIGFEVVFEAE